jgi:hypothetical protein
MRPGAGRCSAVSGLASGVGLVLDVVLRAFWVLGSGSWVAHHGPLARSARSARRQQHNWQLAMSFRISRHLVKRVSTRARCPLAADSRQQTADSRQQVALAIGCIAFARRATGCVLRVCRPPRPSF